ncbi:proteasome chaperone 3 [Monosporozyma unispora]|nr:hypothetical protein C6P44_000747 [Kazachstania unispora]
MSYNFDYHNEFPPNLDSIPCPGHLDINATHFSNAILLHIRLNGEMNCTLDVTRTGLRPVEQDVMHRPIAGIEGSELNSGGVNNKEEDEELFIRDNLSDYNVHIRLGDPNDPKLPVIATQIAELYQRVIIPTLQRGQGIPDNPSSLDIMITLSSKIWSRGDSTDEDFSKLVFVLKCIKDMYQR